MLNKIKSLIKKTGQSVPYQICHGDIKQEIDNLVEQGKLKIIKGKNGWLDTVVLTDESIYCVENDDTKGAVDFIRYYLGDRPFDLPFNKSKTTAELRTEFEEHEEYFARYCLWLKENETKLENLKNLKVK